MLTSESLDSMAPPAAQKPGTSARESERLAALRCLGLLDTPPSESFDRITRLAAETLDVPIVLVSLIDEARQWFKSRVGLDVTETPRQVSFCSHAISNRERLNIPDASRDPRFSSNPLVTGAPHIRAYLGIPIHSLEGHAIGTLCAIDTRPRAFFERHLNTLGDLAKILEESIQARELVALVARQTERLKLTNLELLEQVSKTEELERTVRLLEQRIRATTEHTSVEVG